MTNQENIDSDNKEFWDTPCGTNAAISLGIADGSKESLKKFDDWFFDFYPYLYKHIPFDALKDKKVLEVGLGYGSVAQKIAEAGADYSGLDIAHGPVNLINHRIKQSGLWGNAVNGSILNAPFEDNYFDYIVAIGCYHHTGNLQKALDETYRILKPGGSAIVMIYYKYSYRLWFTRPLATFHRFLREFFNWGKASEVTHGERAKYDVLDDKSTAAPETAFTSMNEFRKMTSQWTSVDIFTENIESFGHIDGLLSRKVLCRYVGWLCGLDLYCVLKK